MKYPIVLIGPMGAGKSTLGKKLAKHLGVTFIDTDKQIAKQHGAIPVLFETLGEQKFREIESDALASALDNQAVIATGGGIVILDRNRELLRNHFVVFLDSSSKHVLPKLNVAKRPLLRDNPEVWDKIYNERLPLYKEVASKTVFTGGKPVSTAIKELIATVEKEGK